MNNKLLILGTLLIVHALAFGSKAISNFAYVTSGPGGVYYSRSVPSKPDGNEGFTEIYRVTKDGDQRIDKYDWYNRNGLILSWSQIAGKIAVMRLWHDENKPFEQQTEFSFYIGGKHLKAYTTSDLLAMGADATPGHPHGKRAAYVVVGPEQIPGTNEYVFSILVGKNKFSFDILTGLLYKELRR